MLVVKKTAKNRRLLVEAINRQKKAMAATILGIYDRGDFLIGDRIEVIIKFTFEDGGIKDA